MQPKLSINANFSELENYKAIHHIVDMMKWSDVREAMLCLDWQWHGDGVPEVYQLKQTALELAECAVSEVIKSKSEWYTETGGISVNAKYYSDNGDVYLKVSFVLSSWDNSL
jgi:hypothetical protein